MSTTQFNGNGSDNDTFGTQELCTWPVTPGVCRFQTRSPEFARKLKDRAGAKLVAWSVDGDYLRIFQEAIEPWRARQLVTRYLARPNGVFSSQISPSSSESDDSDTSEGEE